MGPGHLGAPLRYRTRALGTTAEIVVTDPGALVAAAAVLEQRLAHLDEVASRFRPDSEISALGRAAGRPFEASADLIELLDVALAMAEATGGLVDPTVGAALCRLGYDRDFAQIAGGDASPLPRRCAVPGWRSIEIDHERGTVRIAPGTVVDLGATAKAWAADVIAAAVSTRLGVGALVSLGGDVALGGPVPEEGFAVGLSDLASGESTETVTLRSGGLATSGLWRRRWSRGGQFVHHIIDPETGLPARTPWRTVSVAAASCLEANAASTAALVLGEGATSWLVSRGLPARLVTERGRLATTGGWGTGQPRPLVEA